MRVKLNPFPAVHFHTVCKAHNCPVIVRLDESKAYLSNDVVGGQITTLRCEKGGNPAETDCVGDWEMSISGGGDITITQ